MHGYITDLVEMGMKYFSKFPLCWFIDELPSYVRFILAAILISAMLYHTLSKERCKIQKNGHNSKIRRINHDVHGSSIGMHRELKLNYHRHY